MKKTVFTAIMLFAISGVCFGQTDFDRFIGRFNRLKLPINNVLLLPDDRDTLNGKQVNLLLIRNPKKERPKNYRPQYVDIKGHQIEDKVYYGLYSEGPSKYGCIGIDSTCYFDNRIIPVGKLNLHKNHASVIMKIVTGEAISYDLWNISNEGKPLSLVCLYWGLKTRMDDRHADYIIVNSKINAAGEIIWHENNRGLETFRTYKLNDDGYFQIIKEEQKGEYDY
jgi:hypothetical protein